jgi:1-deoxy-D-xylulose-5-phosphate reductoisomerase
MKKIAILGSTGSIGKSALEVIAHLGPDYQVISLAARGSIEEMDRQIRLFHPKFVAMYDEKAAQELKRRFPTLEIASGMEGLIQAASYSEAEIVLAAMSGTLGLKPTLAAIEAGKTIALANKETLVSGGDLVMKAAAIKGVAILPVDSEHSALFQCLTGEKNESVRRLVLTASGGAFRNHPEDLYFKTARDALQHPTWKMGPKVTIDSSTLMNKGLEVIEAHHLFQIPAEKIEVVIHPESIIHSLVEYVDGSMKAQLSAPDMKLPIQYALTYPIRCEGVLKPFDFIRHSRLEFFQVDKNRFRCLDLAYEAIKIGGSLPPFMNAANEVLVERFLKGDFTWGKIAENLEVLMDRHAAYPITDIEAVFEADRQARAEAAKI